MSSSSSLFSSRSRSHGVDVWGVVRGGANSDVEEIEEEEEPSLDERVMAAMNKLGIIPPEDEDNNDEDNVVEEEDCGDEDGVCAIPEQEESLSGEELEEEFRKEFAELDDSIILAALSATRDVSTDEWNLDAARLLLQQEVDAFQRITADCVEVQTLLAEGFTNVSLVRRALAFVDNSIDDARAILQADEQDAQLELQQQAEEEQQRQEEEEAAKQQQQQTPAIAINVPTNFDPTKTNGASSSASTSMSTPVLPAQVIYDVTASTFQELVLESPVPVLLDVYADWCGPCKALTPALEEITKKAKGAFRLCKINTDQERTITSNALQVKALPTVFAIRQGQIIDSFQGMPRDENELRQFLLRLISGTNNTPKTTTTTTPTTADDYQQQTASVYKIAAMATMPFAKRERLEMYIQDKVCQTWYKKDPSRVRGALELIAKLCSNIIAHPTDPKFKVWNLQNNFFQNQGLTTDNTIFIKQLLPILGFTPSSTDTDKFVYKSKNLAPLMICQSSLDKWISIHSRQLAMDERKRIDQLALSQLEITEEEYDDEYDDEEEEEDDGFVQIRLRIQGKQKVHELKLSSQDTTLTELVQPYLEQDQKEEFHIVCPSKKVSISSTDTETMSSTLQQCSFIGPMTSLVLQFSSSNKSEDTTQDDKHKLQQRAAARRSKQTGYHTMQSVGIYSKDDNVKGELIDGGGGVWYEQDVTTDDEAETQDEPNEEDNEEDHDTETQYDTETQEE